MFREISKQGCPLLLRKLTSSKDFDVHIMFSGFSCNTVLKETQCKQCKFLKVCIDLPFLLGQYHMEIQKISKVLCHHHPNGVLRLGGPVRPLCTTKCAINFSKSLLPRSYTLKGKGEGTIKHPTRTLYGP